MRHLSAWAGVFLNSPDFSGAFLFLGGIPPVGNFAEIYARGRGGLLESMCRNLTRPSLSHGKAQKPTSALGLLHGEARKPTSPLGLLHGEARKPTLPLGLLHSEARKRRAAAFRRGTRGRAGRRLFRRGARVGAGRREKASSYARKAGLPVLRVSQTTQKLRRLLSCFFARKER